MAMHQSKDDIFKRFFLHLRYLTWVHVLYLYDETHLLIVDDEMADYLAGARKEKFRCQVAAPEAYRSAVTPDTRKVLVLTCRDELKIIRALIAEFPDLHVTSGTYGYMRTGRDRYPRMIKFDAASFLPRAQPVVFLSTPYADAEFVTSVMAENGLPYAHEFLGRHYASWLMLHRPFQVSRFYAGVEKKYAKDGRLFYHLQTDVLRALFDNSAFSMERFVRYLKQMNARVIIVQRRDTLTQATIGHLLGKTGERSAWSKKPTKKLNTPLKANGVLDSFAEANTINNGVLMLDEVRKSGAHTMDVVLEDFASDQENEIKRIATFIGSELPDEMTTLSYMDAYKATPALHKGADKVRRDLLDRLGLHI